MRVYQGYDARVRISFALAVLVLVKVDGLVFDVALVVVGFVVDDYVSVVLAVVYDLKHS